MMEDSLVGLFTPDVGTVRKDLTQYHKNVGSYDPDKIDQRSRVLDFMIRNNDGRDLRWLSLPGHTWETEHELIRLCQRKTLFLLGVERERPTWIRGLRRMPGADPRQLEWLTSRGPRYYCLQTAAKLTVCSVLGKLQEFLLEDWSPIVFSADEREAWHRIYHRASAIWLDLSSSSSSKDAEVAIYNLDRVLDHERARVPVAVTVGGYRDRTARLTVSKLAADRSDSTSHRVQWIQSRLEGIKRWTFTAADSWPYGRSMFTVMGILTPKP